MHGANDLTRSDTREALLPPVCRKLKQSILLLRFTSKCRVMKGLLLLLNEKKAEAKDLSGEDRYTDSP